MSSAISHCLILLMKPIWDLENQKQELNVLEEPKKEYIGSVQLKLLHLEGVDKTALKKSAGDDRQFLVGVRKLNDAMHPGHLCIEIGVGLIQLLRWIIKDEF